MRRLPWITFLAAVCSTACSSAGAYTSTDDAAVYEALLQDHCCIDRAILQVLTDTASLSPTSRRRGYEEDTRNLSSDTREAVRDLYARSASVRALPDSLSVSGQDQRIDPDSARRLVARISSESLRRLPDSSTVVMISAIGYNQERTVAVVRTVQVCGFLCGGINVQALRRHPAGWLPAEDVWTAVF